MKQRANFLSKEKHNTIYIRKKKLQVKEFYWMYSGLINSDPNKDSEVLAWNL